MSSGEAVEILRGKRNVDGVEARDAMNAGAEALELLEWIEKKGVKIEYRGGLSASFDPWLVNAGKAKSDAVTGRTLVETLRAARKESR